MALVITTEERNALDWKPLHKTLKNPGKVAVEGLPSFVASRLNTGKAKPDEKDKEDQIDLADQARALLYLSYLIKFKKLPDGKFARWCVIGLIRVLLLQERSRREVAGDAADCARPRG